MGTVSAPGPSFEEFCAELARQIEPHCYENSDGSAIRLCHVFTMSSGQLLYPGSQIRRNMLRYAGRRGFKQYATKLLELVEEIEEGHRNIFGVVLRWFYHAPSGNHARVAWLKDLARGKQPL